LRGVIRIGVICVAPALCHAGVCGNLTEDQMVRRVRAEQGMAPLGRAQRGMVHGRSSLGTGRARAHSMSSEQRVSMSGNVYPCLTRAGMLTPADSRNDPRAAVRWQMLRAKKPDLHRCMNWGRQWRRCAQLR
jgi:hypothetical protein